MGVVVVNESCEETEKDPLESKALSPVVLEHPIARVPVEDGNANGVLPRGNPVKDEPAYLVPANCIHSGTTPKSGAVVPVAVHSPHSLPTHHVKVKEVNDKADVVAKNVVAAPVGC